MFRRIFAVLAAVVSVAAVSNAGTTYRSVDLVVTPIVTEALTASPTYYNFGALNVETSSNSASAIVLQNTGGVGITLEKAVSADGAWDVTQSSAVTDGFDLWAQCNATRPNMNTFTTGNTHNFNETALNTYNNLTTNAGAQVSLTPTSTANMWFMIDMPKSVTVTDAQTITVSIKAIGQ